MASEINLMGGFAPLVTGLLKAQAKFFSCYLFFSEKSA